MKSKKLRTRTSWFVAIILVPPFIIAFQSFITPPSDTDPIYNAGTLFGKPVTRETFDLHFLALRRNFENRLAVQNPNFTEIPQVFDTLIEQQTWNRLLLLYEAKRRKLRVLDTELAAIIRSTSAFQVNEHFAPDRYAQVIRAIGMNTKTYEDFLRDELRVSRLVESIHDEVRVTDEDLREAYREANEQLRAEVLFSKPDDFRTAIRAELTDEVLQEAYDSRPQLVRIPEKITFKWAGMNEEGLAASVEIPEDDIQTHYEINYEARLSEPAFSGEREILDDSIVRAELAKPEVPSLEDVRDEIIEAIRPRHIRRAFNILIVDIEEGRREGRSLDELAESLDLPVTSVGPIERGGISPQIPNQSLLTEAFSLEVGETSGVVETSDSAYLVEVTAKEEAFVPPFESVKNSIADTLEDERSQEAARQQAESWRTTLTKALDAGTPSEEALEALGVEVVKLEPFTRTETLVDMDLPNAAIQTAFKTPIGQPTEVIRTSKRYTLLIPREILAPDEEGFDEQEEALREKVLTKKQDTHFSEWLSALRVEADMQDFSLPEQQFQPGDVIQGPTGEPITIPAR